MRNITIGLAGPDWRASEAARYYAERGNGDDYAFGKTPAEALAKLEEREAAADLRFDETIAEEVAFLALGAAGFLQDRRDADLSAFGGYMGIINEVARCAPVLAERWKRMGEDGFDGVWLYDVTERFGREWVEALVGGVRETPADLLECIIEDEMQKW